MAAASTVGRAALGVALASGVAAWGVAVNTSPATIERVYTQGAYPIIAQAITTLTGTLPFALVEPATVAGVILLAVGLLRAKDRHGWGGVVVTALTTASVAYAVFLGVWGFNYRREPVAVPLGLEVRASSVEELRALAAALVDAASARRETLSALPDGSLDVPGGLDNIYARCSHAYLRAGDSVPFPTLPLSAPKSLVISPLLSWMGLLGFYFPPTGEPNINVEAPLQSIPFTTLHEMAHARGVASEDEASYIAYRVARASGDGLLAYSAAWSTMRYAVNTLATVDRDAALAIWAQASPGVRQDSDTWKAWMAAHESPLRGIADTVNDTYLRSQGVPDGTMSYGRVLDLILADYRTTGAVP